MRFVFDPDKDKSNLAEHDLPLSFAEKLVWDEAYVWVDPRYSYDELRMIGLDPEGNTLYSVALVDRGDVRRIISLRLAARRPDQLLVESPWSPRLSGIASCWMKAIPVLSYGQAVPYRTRGCPFSF